MSIAMMEKRDWLFEVPSRKESESILDSGHILQLKLSELAKRDIAIRIYSEVLGCEIWLCGTEQMASQIKQDDPEAVIYTVGELRRLYRLNPDPESLRSIHNAKAIFPGSKVIDSRLKERSDEPDRT